MPFLGMNLRVTTDSKQGGRRYMEDVISVEFVKAKDGKELDFVYLAVYDGHGGAEAAQFAKRHLMNEITKHKGFWSQDDVQVMKAIKDGFNSTHRLMWKAVGSWPKTVTGLPSTSGSTASVVFIKDSKMYCGHVGDSGIVMGIKDKLDGKLKAHCVTVDHKPDCPKERKRIEGNGGQVVAKAGVQRVVWNRPRATHQGPVRRSTHIDKIPFLAVARSLGDLWSYNSEQNVFVVSPEPDVCMYKLDLRKHRCLVLASDGLWNMVKPKEAIDLVDDMEKEWQNYRKTDPNAVPKKPAVSLVHLGLDRWNWRCLRADNTSVIVAMLDPPGPSKTVCGQNFGSFASIELNDKSSDGEDHCHSSSDCESDDDETFRQDLADIEMGEEDDNEDAELSPPWETMSGTGLCSKLPAQLVKPQYLNFPKPPLKRTPPRPIYTGRPISPKSAPPKLTNGSALCKMWQDQNKSSVHGNVSHFFEKEDEAESSTKEDSCKALRPHGLFEKVNCALPQSESSSSMASPIKTPCPASLKTPIKNIRKRRHSDSDSAKSSVSPRGLRSRSSPRQVGINLTNNSSPMKRQSGSRPCTNLTTALFQPKEATSAKSPLKVDTACGQLGSPSGLVSPIWPSCLEVGMEIEVASEVLPKHGLLAKMPAQREVVCSPCPSEESKGTESESENVEHSPVVTPVGVNCGVKRKSTPHNYGHSVKRLRPTPPSKTKSRLRKPGYPTYNTRAHFHKQLSPTKIAC